MMLKKGDRVQVNQELEAGWVYDIQFDGGTRMTIRTSVPYKVTNPGKIMGVKEDRP